MITAAIVAGGKGERMGSVLPKQFLKIGDKEIIIHTLEKFISCKKADRIAVGINPDYYDYAEKLFEGYFGKDRIILINGGSDRNETINNIVTYLQKNLQLSGNDILLTHDAVRPYTDERIICDVIEAMAHCDACTAAIPSTDTICTSSDGLTAEDFPDRSKLFMVQTPQAFRIKDWNDVYSSLSSAQKSIATDVCRLFILAGKKVSIVPGSPENIKITYKSDLN